MKHIYSAAFLLMIFVLPAGQIMAIAGTVTDGNGPDPFQVPASQETDEQVTAEFRLLENYPNPFNPETAIRYSVDTPGQAVIRVYNLTGQEVWSETRSHSTAGVYDVRFNAINLTSGIYLARVTLNNRISNVIKMTLLK